MATKVYIAADGSQHNTKADAENHENEAGLLSAVVKLEGKKAKDILAWFKANFRVPKVRKPRTPKAAPAPVASAEAVAAETAAA